MAEDRGLGDRIRASSLGTLGIEGRPAHEWTIEVAAEKGADLIAFRSRGLDPARAAEADLLVALGHEHLPHIREIVKGLPAHPRVWLISAPGVDAIPEHGGALGREGIPDPVAAKDAAEYRLALAAIDGALPALWESVRGLVESPAGE
jgi:protein-tyrosine-phosphatase